MSYVSGLNVVKFTLNEPADDVWVVFNGTITNDLGAQTISGPKAFNPCRRQDDQFFGFTCRRRDWDSIANQLGCEYQLQLGFAARGWQVTYNPQ